MAQRDLLKIIFQNFMKSIRPREFTGTFRGTDLYGNKYFEKVADPSVGRRKPSRYFVPPKKSDFMNEVSPEWEAWLRGRRNDAPTEEELQYNKAFMEMKQQKAKAIDEGLVKPEPQQVLEAKRGVESFPTYGDEYEVSAGYKSTKTSWKK